MLSTLVKVSAIARAASGLYMAFAPGAATAPIVGDDGVDDPLARHYVQGLGIRDAMLGGLALMESDPRSLARLQQGGSIADGFDAATLLLIRDRLNGPAATTMVGAAIASCLIGTVLAQALRRQTARDDLRPAAIEP